MFLTASAALAQEPPPQTAQTIPFESVPDFLKLPPNLYVQRANDPSMNLHRAARSRQANGMNAYGFGPSFQCAQELRQF
jgi:hypothetical protein